MSCVSLLMPAFKTKHVDYENLVLVLSTSLR